MIKIPGASPRWIIFAIDVFVVCAAWAIALNYWLTLLSEPISGAGLFYTFIPVVLVNVALFLQQAYIVALGGLPGPLSSSASSLSPSWAHFSYLLQMKFFSQTYIPGFFPFG